MNLVINAKEAITERKGSISILASHYVVRSCDMDMTDLSLPVGEYALIKVSDNGCGMDEKTKHNIFDPFFTTKPDGQGLGMSAILGIVKNHNGLIRLESEPGKGTTFYIYLPIPDVKDMPENTMPKNKLQADFRKRDFTILVADDEEVVRDVAKMLLEELGGNKVILAVNGKEALDIFNSAPESIDLIIADLRMPVMGGWDFIKEIRKLDKELPVYASSGFSEEEIKDSSTELINGFLNKPYSFESMERFMKEVKSGKK
jgi:CheY-like chemotaxis protein